jgi:hypothetical protein
VISVWRERQNAKPGLTDKNIVKEKA